MATVRIDPERVLRICNDALAHADRNQPALDEAVKCIGTTKPSPLESFDIANCIRQLRCWQAAAQLACEPLAFDGFEALHLKVAGSPRWAALILQIIEAAAAIQDEQLSAFVFKPSDFVKKGQTKHASVLRRRAADKIGAP